MFDGLPLLEFNANLFFFVISLEKVVQPAVEYKKGRAHTTGLYSLNRCLYENRGNGLAESARRSRALSRLLQSHVFTAGGMGY